MKFWNKFCGIVLFFSIFCPVAQAQNDVSIKLSNNTFLFKTKLITADSVSHLLATSVLSTGFQGEKSIISGNFSTSCYGFFCRQELKIEKATHIPFRFRLGSLQQCNYYEGKE